MRKRKSFYTFGLGLILDDKKRPIMHRTMLKILVNPILRIFGKNLASDFSISKVMKCQNEFSTVIQTTVFQFNGYKLKNWDKTGKNTINLFITGEKIINSNAKFIILDRFKKDNKYSTYDVRHLFY